MCCASFPSWPDGPAERYLPRPLKQSNQWFSRGGCSSSPTMKISLSPTKSDFSKDWEIEFVMAVVMIRMWSALSPAGSKSVFPNEMDLCLSFVSFTRLTRTRAGGMCPVPNSVISCDSRSYSLRSPNLLATKRRDPCSHLEPRRNLLADWNAIDLT
jgi:hypothetical protein